MAMTFLKKLFGSAASEAPKTYTPKSEHEAWIAIMYACMYIDGHISEGEIRQMFEVVEKLPMFKGKEIVDYYQPALLANKRVGSYMLIDGSVHLIKEDQKIFLFELIMQLLLVDGKLFQKEKEIAAYLTRALNIPSEAAEHSMEEVCTRNAAKP